jgi:hypothetical protein
MEPLGLFVYGTSVIASSLAVNYKYSGTTVPPYAAIAFIAAWAAWVVWCEVGDRTWRAEACAHRLRVPVARIRALVNDPWLLRHNVWNCNTEADVAAVEQTGAWPWLHTPVPGAKKGK